MANCSDSQGLPKRLLSAHHKGDINIPLIPSEIVISPLFDLKRAFVPFLK